MADTANITLKGESEAINFIDEALRGDIAYEELSTTVSKTGGYVAGDHLIYLGQYYEVVADIAQGGTIVTSGAGQNVEEREVGDEIKKNKTQVLGVICDVETSPATAAHSAGDQFYYDGALVEATSAIAIGDTIVVSPDTGYNVKVADKVVAQIQTLMNKLNNEAATRSAMGAKNLIPFDLASIKAKNSHDYPSGSWNNNEWTLNGVTFAIQDDNTVVATGANTSNSNAQLDYYITIEAGVSYIANGCPSGGSYTTYEIANYCLTSPVETFHDLGNGVVITREAKTDILVHMQVKAGYTIDGQLVFKPMIRLATDSDATYQPYAKTNQELTAENEALTNQANDMVNVLGAKNLLPNKATTQVSYGVTFTVNDDGSVKANGTNDGTQTSAIFPFVVARNLIADYFPSMDETYVGYMSASNTLLELLIIWEDENKTTISQTRTKTKVEFTIPSNAVYFRCDFRVAQNATVSNEIAYPMICLKSVYDLDDTFEPYAKTNQQLTQDSVTWDNLSEVGAENHLKNNATTTTTTDGTTTFTWTVNDDKSVTVSAPSYPVAAASNQTLMPWDNISADECNYLVGKVFKLTGCPSGGSRDTYRLQIYRVLSADGSSGTAEEYGEGKIFTWLNNGSGIKAKVQMIISSGYTMTGPITFKPMLTDVSYNGPYVPYAKTNKELTEDVSGRFIVKNFRDSVSVTADGVKTYKTLLNELATAFKNMALALGKGEIAKVIGITDSGSLGYMPCATNSYFANNTSDIMVSGMKCTAASDGTSAIMSVTVNSTLNSVYAGKMAITSSGNTFTDYRDTVATSGKVFSIYYEIYQNL